MGKLVCATVIVALLCGLLGCGASADKAPPTTQPAAVTSQVFLAGFGKADFTPTDPVPMGGYGNSLERMSTGILSYLEARAVVVPYEMFDTNGMEIKAGTPFAITFITSYAWPAYKTYIASELAWQNGGYECDNSTYVRGTAEELVAAYLEILKDLKG